MSRKKNTQLSPVQEDYLEAIYIIIHIEKNPAARVTDIANELKVNKSNVSNTMKVLSEAGYVNYNTYRWITLTEKGYREAKTIYGRHQDLIVFFHDVLGLDEKTAEENACRIEHSIDNLSMSRLKQFAKFIKTHGKLKYNKDLKQFQVE